MWYIKSEEETDPRYGKEPEKRSIEELINTSIINVDKPSGPTSHQVTAWLRDMFGVKKAGHSGTLDPKVTGVLPVALGKATRAMPLFIGLDKEYVGVMHLHKDVSIDELRSFIAENFIGEITQVPPVKSAVKRRPRKRVIHYFDVLEMEGRDVLFRIGCQAGTYVRKVVHDLGKKMGIGAHMTELRRTMIGKIPQGIVVFEEKKSHNMIDIKDALEFWREEGEEKYLRKILVPIEYAILHVKRVFVKDSVIDAICHGAPVYVPGLVRIQKGIEKGEKIAIYSLKNELVAIGVAEMSSEEMFNSKRGLAVRTDRVFMERGTYPKRW